MVTSSKSFGARMTPGGTRTESAAVGRSATAVSILTEPWRDVGGDVGLAAGERYAFQLDVVGHAPILRPAPERLPVRRAPQNRIRHRVLRHDQRNPLHSRRHRPPLFPQPWGGSYSQPPTQSY